MNDRSAVLLFFLWSLGLVAQEKQVDSVLNNWHAAAAAADFDGYFELMSPDAVFIGTDATEYWKVAEFKDFAKPYFDRGKAWDFTPVSRHIYFNEDLDIAWFDELLDTQMKLCRGSGTLRKSAGEWKIAHYVLSIAVPNDQVPALIALKKENDSILVSKLKKR
ncbi:nuclear transport factor 2 family protein [Maribacter sp. 2-571]|uniref:nuclear transport factor 2 family protein n=1 Tax=Maribacter sp. 2-571 TaxID=3417569 RepID=UPI003D3315A9